MHYTLQPHDDKSYQWGINITDGMSACTCRTVALAMRSTTNAVVQGSGRQNRPTTTAKLQHMYGTTLLALASDLCWSVDHDYYASTGLLTSAPFCHLSLDGTLTDAMASSRKLYVRKLHSQEVP